jgi:signal transduction histidine kinase
VPAAVDVSAYRIVQEALTNVLKHAGSARAEVTVGCADDAVTIEVTDDGADLCAAPALATADLGPAGARQAGGQGLTGMRERVALFGGELVAGPKPSGGFTVRARLPLRDGSS